MKEKIILKTTDEVLDMIKHSVAGNSYRIKKYNLDMIGNIFTPESNFEFNEVIYEEGHHDDNVVWVEVEGLGYGWIGANPDEEKAVAGVKALAMERAQKALDSGVDVLLEVDTDLSFSGFSNYEDSATTWVIPLRHLEDKDIYISFSK